MDSIRNPFKTGVLWPNGQSGFNLHITQRKRAEEEIKNLAFYDPLTQLPNRRLLMDRLKQALASSARSGREGALLFIDLDNFKALNDTLGHDVGDLLLQQVAQRLESCVREGDTVARLGGDEFVVMLEDLSEDDLESAAQAETVGDKILSTLNQPYQFATHEHRSTPSIGVTLFSDHAQNQDELLKQADIAMYQAKKAGRNSLRFFDPQMQETITVRASLESDLRRAVAEQKEFQLFYQVQVDSSGGPVGAEALLRWQHPERGMVSPAEFIPLAEETGLILPLGHWVMATACRQLAAWVAQPETAHLTLAVNVSVKQFHLPTFVEEVLTLIGHFKIDPAKLELEITESMLLGNVDDIIAKMTTLKARGISFSMDDFGTGYSSLQYLKRLPLDQLKIDQSFVCDIATDDSDKAIVRTIIAMAQSLNLNVIAEGVETEEQRQLLLNKGCAIYQGYLFGRPVPIEQFEALL
ncbi:MAG: EAL domain-containing protein [Nitrosomonadales bacterium]|nr:EAL domain-containing protein [Nitrosomonadales bacterium]